MKGNEVSRRASRWSAFEAIARIESARRTLNRVSRVDWHRLAAGTAMIALMAQAQAAYFPMTFPMALPGGGISGVAGGTAAPPVSEETTSGVETIIGGYVGIPSHNRSDVHIVRPDGTDLTMKGLRWDGEPFTFPLYAGVRAVHWRGSFGGMIDFLHDKAVTRVGKGAHGRRVTGERAIVDTVELEGKIKGQPAPPSAKITDIVERLEFTHGHNMLLPTAMLRLGYLAPRLRPYVGVGAGVALPHVEVWPTGEGEAAKTNEYQAAGPAMQFVFGLEWQGARGPVFVEYKYTWADLKTALTGGKTPAWCNCDFVSDAARHISNWWNGVQPQYGSLHTTLVTHQIVGGAGYRVSGAAAVQK